MASLLAQLEPVSRANDSASPVASGVFASPLLWAAVIFAAGLWLSLPQGRLRGRRLGLLLTVVGLGVFASQLPLVGGWLDQGLFSALAAVTVLSCTAAIIARNPVYAAIWFGLALLGTAALFLFSGAQFLGVATVTVYAGAILVTFLFVIMLAQPRGHAHYDRVSWEAFLSAATGAILVGLLTTTIDRSFGTASAPASAAPAVVVSERASAARHGVLTENHVAHLGQELLGKHLISMQAAGALLLAALVGVVAIVAQGRKSAAATELASGRLFRTAEEAHLVLPGQPQHAEPRHAPGGIHA
jgi:NADH-quinone oxidoreductase subunit J